MKFLHIICLACLAVGSGSAAWGDPAAEAVAPLPPAGAPAQLGASAAAPSLADQMFGEPAAQPRGLAAGPADTEANPIGPSPAPMDGLQEDIGDVGAMAHPGVRWYASIAALVMGRNKGDKVWTSVDALDPTVKLTNTQEIPLAWEWGDEVSIGCRSPGGDWTVEGTFWMLVPKEGAVTTQTGGLLNSPLTTIFTTYNGFGFDSWFNDSVAHYIWRNDEVYNVELNVIRNRIGQGDPWSMEVSLGARYFHFRDMLHYAADSSWLTGRAVFVDDVANDLVGGQLGINAQYYFIPTLRLFFMQKVGLYDNLMYGKFDAYVGDTSQRATQNFYPGQQYPVRAQTSSLAVMAEWDAGAEWQITPNWQVRFGYRLLAATGLAMSDNQFPQNTADMPALGELQHHSSLILNGAFLGCTFCY
jgi:hypothetical protein